MTTYRIADRLKKVVRIDLPEFATVAEAADFIFLELFDFSGSVYYVTPIER